MTLSSAVALLVALTTSAVVAENCRFAHDFTCDSFRSELKRNEYLSNVMRAEGQFAQPGIAYDPNTGYTFDGHPLEYTTGALYGEPHLFSAPSKESIHVSILARAIEGDKFALEFAGGFDKAIEVLELKMKGYSQFNATYPGYGCFTPWVSFNSTRGTFDPIESWTVPYNKVPGLDNGEWFWALYAVSVSLAKLGPKYSQLASQYADFVQCQKDNVKTIFYRGEGDVSATVYILDATIAPNGNTSNYVQCDGYLNDPYEGETMTQMLYLYSDFATDEEREMLWTKKYGLFEAVNYEVPQEARLAAGMDGGANKYITVQKGFWFSSHEQWKTLLMPYLAKELPLVRKVFANAERVRSWDAYSSRLPGMLASINDVTNGSQDIPDYASACGIEGISYQKIERRDIMTPYGAYGLFLHNQTAGLCWYNNMLSAPRMQSKYGSTEAINVNGTEISPITTWDSKITTVLAMLGGVGDIVERGLRSERDAVHGTAFDRFVYVVNREHERVFGSIDKVLGEEFGYRTPRATVPTTELSDWQC